MSAGPLRSYVMAEVNVFEMETCDDPTQFCDVRAQPEWQVRIQPRQAHTFS